MDKKDIHLVIFFLTFIILFYANSQSVENGIEGIWIRKEVDPPKIVVIVKADDSFRMTILPGNTVQRFESYLSTFRGSELFFGNEDHYFFLYPDQGDGVLTLAEGFKGVDDTFPRNYQLLLEKEYIKGWLVCINPGARLRIAPDTDIKARTIRIFEKGEVVKLIEIGKRVETIQGKKDFWIKIKTDQSEEGWIFGANFEKLESMIK